MRLFPVALDFRPPYLAESASDISLLLMPLGQGNLLDYLQTSFSEVTKIPPIVLTTFVQTPAYEAAIRKACPRVEAILPAAELGSRLGAYQPSDWLLITDSRQLPVEGLDFRGLVTNLDRASRWVRHLVTLEATIAGTQEYVQFDPSGRVSRIQRYYEDVTWPFASGVTCSLVPVACTQRAGNVPFHSLPDLRTSLAGQGVASRDAPITGGTFDLSHEHAFLTLSERFVLGQTPASGPRPPNRAPGATVHPTARILGPVIIQDGAIIEEGATVAGPAVVGCGARVGPNALVAQCVVVPGTSVTAGTRQRHRVLAEGRDGGLSTGSPATAAEPFVAPLGGPAGLPELREDRRASRYPTLKTWIEPILGLAVVILLSPLLLLVALIVKLESHGPIFYGDKREGFGGRVFRCWKFRTMIIDADARQRELVANNQMDGPQFKLANDPRVTRIGRYLRPLSIDELPQFFNVLFGQMSFVGPRPSPFRENQMCVPWREGRLSVRPGITGLWQVCRHDRSIGDFHQWIYYDLLYVRNMSFLVDIKIVLATIVTLGGKWSVPLDWILSRSKYHDRRRSRRGPGSDPSQQLARGA
jgi:lipopolysaccharide/colanic/teichoic acid biosynthesis glycosyltransferase/carbonic anhydrase/acetyltransferase-like protein (isoleucine patch superfamily)